MLYVPKPFLISSFQSPSYRAPVAFHLYVPLPIFHKQPWAEQPANPSLEVITTTLATFFTNKKITQLLLLIYQFKFRSAFLYYLSLAFVTSQSAISAVDDLVSCCGHELWTMSLISDHNLDSVEMNQHAKNLGQRSFCSTYYPDTQTRKHTHVTHIVMHRHTHTRPIARPEQLKWLNTDIEKHARAKYNAHSNTAKQCSISLCIFTLWLRNMSLFSLAITLMQMNRFW